MSDSGAKEKESFWTTLPGILTGVAALLTALATLIAIFLPNPPDPSKPSPEISPALTRNDSSSQTVSSPLTREAEDNRYRESAPETPVTSPGSSPSESPISTSVVGNWDWPGIGTATLQQQGSRVTGLVQYNNGHQAEFEGQLNGGELVLTWWFSTGRQASSSQDPQGNGRLFLSDNGRVLEGEFMNIKENQGPFPWRLNRISP